MQKWNNEVIKETKRQEKKNQKQLQNIKTLTKATNEIPAPSNTSQRKSSQARKKSRVVLENYDLSTEKFIEEESAEGLYVSLFSHNLNKSRKIIFESAKKRIKRVNSGF